MSQTAAFGQKRLFGAEATGDETSPRRRHPHYRLTGTRDALPERSARSPDCAPHPPHPSRPPRAAACAAAAASEPCDARQGRRLRLAAPTRLRSTASHEPAAPRVDPPVWLDSPRRNPVLAVRRRALVLIGREGCGGYGDERWETVPVMFRKRPKRSRALQRA